MRPLYFNPLDNTGNFIGTNPLGTEGVPIKTSFYPYFNPSIYQSFTFYSFPVQTAYYSSSLLGSAQTNLQTTYGDLQYSVLGGEVEGDYANSIVQCYSVATILATQFSTFETFFASYYQLQPVTYSVRFGTEEQPLYASTSEGVDTWYTCHNTYSEQIVYYSVIIQHWTFIDTFSTQYWKNGSDDLLVPLQSNITSTVIDGSVVSYSVYQNAGIGQTPVGSSSFVNLLGSNVYAGLIDTTNSIIVYQNEQVSSYYSQSLSYQVNIANLTAALNSVSGSGSAAEGDGDITVTYFSWIWETTQQGWTGSQLTDFSNYLSTAVVNNYLSATYGGTTITHSTLAVTQVQSLITVQNNDLSNSQTFMNNAVTTLQSQVSLAGQIIGTLASIMQDICNNI